MKTSPKKLSEMTLHELWELFPIILTPHNDQWKMQYLEMEQCLRRELSDYPVIRISHIGSTSIKGIYAKPIVDILVEIETVTDRDAVAKRIKNCGFTPMSRYENRLSFNSGYTEDGFADKVYHLHLRYFGDNDELYFRDYLAAHPDVANEYQKLKIKLWHQYEHNRDAYTDAKSEFVKKYTDEAKSQYGHRY